MNWTRRAVLGCAASLPALMRGQTWHDDRLGIACHLGATETSARKTLGAARAAGFSRAQIQIPWARVDNAYLRSLPVWLNSEDVRAEVLGAYVNCCDPETVIMDCRREDFARAISLAGSLGAHCLVAWTGGYGQDLMQSDPRNFTPQAESAVKRFVEMHTRRLEDAGLTLALETYITLACPDARSLKRLLDALPTHVGAVLDPPNLTPIARYPQRDEELREIVRLLRGRVAPVHLKDFRLAQDGKSYDLPGPMDGSMNYRLFAELILSLPGAPPVIAEHLPPERFQEARRRLLPVFGSVTR